MSLIPLQITKRFRSNVFRWLRTVGCLVLSAMMGGWADASFTNLSWGEVVAAPNYRPTGCTEDGSFLPADSVRVTRITGEYDTDHYFGYVDVTADIQADLVVNCPNGVTLKAHLYARRFSQSGSLGGSDVNFSMNFSDSVSATKAWRQLPTGPIDWSSNGWWVKLKEIPAWFLEELHNKQESDPGAFFPPADTGDRRVLARPILFTHGVSSNAAGWGVKYADRTCGQSLQGFLKWNVSSEAAVNAVKTSYTGPASSVTGYARISQPRLEMAVQMNCAFDTHQMIDSIGLDLDRVTQSWSVNEPWMGFFYRDNPLLFQYEESGNGNWRYFGAGIPQGDLPVRVRVLRPKPGNLQLVTDRWSYPNIVNLDFTDFSTASWTAMTSQCPTLTQVFTVQNGRMQAVTLEYDTTILAIGNAVRSANVASGSVVPWEQFSDRSYSYTLPNTYSDALVRDYKFSTGPDILARIERLDRRYDSLDPLTGINRNGIYFYNALADAGDVLSEIQPPMWNPASFGYTAQRGQALQLFERMDTVLSRHYGSREAWIHDPSKQIDIVCHSQGCLVTRDMIRNAHDTALSNPVNHIRKVVSLNSPAFGSALATSTADMPAQFGSMGEIRRLLLDTAGQLIPNKDLSLGFLRLTPAAPLAGGVGGAIQGYQTCAEAVDVPGLSQLAGVTCANGGFLLGAITGPFTNVSWSLNGGLLGPYDLRMRTNRLGFVTIDHLKLPDPVSMRQMAKNFADTTRHLSQKSIWIEDLRLAGYPTRPLDSAPVPFSVRHSPTTGHIVDTLGLQLADNLRQYCQDHDDVFSANCTYLETVLNSVLGTNSISTDATVNQILQWTRDFQTQWTDQGDLVVEKESQLMVNPTFGFDPNDPALHFDTAGYRYQTTYGVGGAKIVAHMPVGLDASQKVNGTNMRLRLVRPGAAMLGLDIHAALGYDTLAFTHGIQPLPKQGVSVLVPAMRQSIAPTMAVVQQLPVAGDFDVAVMSGDSLIQGLVVRTDSTGVLQVVAVRDRTQGVYLTAVQPDGTRTTKIVTNWSRPVQVRLARTGSKFTLRATGLDGLVDTASVTLNLGSNVWLGALSTASVAASDTLRPLLTGNVTVTDVSRLHVNDPWNLVPVVRQTSTSDNGSHPAIVLINKDTRTLSGFTLHFDFQADPARTPLLQSYQGPGNATLVSLGRDLWRVKIAVPNGTVSPQSVYPSADGFRFQLAYQDGSSWPRRAEWSSYSGSEGLRWSGRVQVLDNTGKVLTGEEIPREPEPANAAVVGFARDEALASGNLVAPVVVVRNTGGTPLRDFHVVWTVRAPMDKTVALETWYTPESQASIKPVGAGLWQIDLKFSSYILYPGQSTAEQKFGIHLPLWEPWDRTKNPTATTAGQGLVPVSEMVVLDSNGVVLWGNAPNLPDTTVVVPPVDPPQGADLPVAVQIRDENTSDNTWIRPRMILTNQGATTLTRFALRFPLTTNPAKPVNVAPWYAPGCQVGLVRTASGADTAKYVCQNLSVAPGAIWPDQGGAVVGFQYTDNTLWSRTQDPFVATWTQTFAPTTVVKVRDLP